MIQETEEFYIRDLSKEQQKEIIGILIEYEKCYVIKHKGGRIDISTACLIDNETDKKLYVFTISDFDFDGTAKYVTPWHELTRKYCKEGNDIGVKAAGEIYKAQNEYVKELVWRRWMNKAASENK